MPRAHTSQLIAERNYLVFIPVRLFETDKVKLFIHIEHAGKEHVNSNLMKIGVFV